MMKCGLSTELPSRLATDNSNQRNSSPNGISICRPKEVPFNDASRSAAMHISAAFDGKTSVTFFPINA